MGRTKVEGVTFMIHNLKEFKRNSCDHKIRFENTLKAKEFVLSKNNKNIKSGKYEHCKKIYIYECTFCKGWHFGHNSTWRNLMEGELNI